MSDVKPISDDNLDKHVNRWGRVIGTVTDAEIEGMAARIRKDAVEIRSLRWRLDEAATLQAECARLRGALETARADERERCAKIADAASADAPMGGEIWIASNIANAIRALKDPSHG